MATVRHIADTVMQKLKISLTYIIEAIHNKNSLTWSTGDTRYYWLIMHDVICIG